MYSIIIHFFYTFNERNFYPDGSDTRTTQVGSSTSW